ncbi:chemotaxis protein MotB [Candidatus Magnetomoraceae bacterium gMMP-15]
MSKYYQEEADFNIWPTYADISFSILLVLIFIMLAQYVVIGNVLQVNKNIQEQELLTEKLKQNFPGEYGTAIKDYSQPQFQKITFSDKILFDVGSDVLKSEGKAILKKIAIILNMLKERRAFDEIQIRGHTDDQPMKSRWAKFSTNWELSSARATSVVRFFVDECGFKPHKGLLLSAQGYSEYDYIKENTDDESRALNRRIEIVIKYPLSF